MQNKYLFKMGSADFEQFYFEKRFNNFAKKMLKNADKYSIERVMKQQVASKQS